jgi:hypothetical protein
MTRPIDPNNQDGAFIRGYVTAVADLIRWGDVHPNSVRWALRAASISKQAAVEARANPSDIAQIERWP